MYEHMTEAEISRQTQIPRSTLYDIRHGKYDLPAYSKDKSINYHSTLELAYQRETYSLLQESGFSIDKARIYRHYAASTVSDYLTRMDRAVDNITSNALLTVQKVLIEKNMDFDHVSEYEKLRKEIVKLMRRSTKETEDIFSKYA